MGKRSRSRSATRHLVVSSASPRSPPFKKRALSQIYDLGMDGDKNTNTVSSQACHEVQLPSVIPSVSPSSSSVGFSALLEEGQYDRDGSTLAGVKRNRDNRNTDHDGSLSDTSASLHASTRRRGEGRVLPNGPRASSSVIANPAGPTTNRTLVYDTGCATLSRSKSTPSSYTAASSTASSSSRPPHRNVVLLTSTPAFLRHGKLRDIVGGDNNNNSPDSASHSSTAAMPSPLRLMMAVQEFLSPVRSTLLRGFSHLRPSVPGARTATNNSAQPTAPQRRSDVSTPLPPSPWGRLSSIKPTHDHLPSLSLDPRREISRRSGRGGQLRQLATSAPTLLSLGVSSISGSRRSSVSASNMWGINEDVLSGGEGQQRPTIQRDSEDERGNSASLRTASSSLSLSRMSSPTVREVEAVDHGATYHHRHQRNSSEVADARMEEPHRRGGGPAGAATALAGPYDARYASVSSLSESLVKVVSSSRSTAQSSLTSAGAAAGDGADQKSVLSAAHGTSAGTTRPRSSATFLEPNLSSILPDEEEQAIRRRMQRHRQDRTQGKSAVAQKGFLPQHAPANVLELPSVRPTVTDEASAVFQIRRGGTSRTGAKLNADAGRAQQGSGGAASTSNTNRQRREHCPFRSATASTPLRRFAGHLSRTLFGLCALMIVFWCLAATAWPLLALQAAYGECQGRGYFPPTSSPSSTVLETAFLFTYVNPVSDLQALYQVAPASLDMTEVNRLHRRTLSEGVERLERATQHLVPQENTQPPHRLFYFRAMIHAYLMVQRNSELYARSRDASLWRRLVGYSLDDIRKYGLYRFGSLSRGVTLTQSFVRDWQDRLLTSVACSAQSEFVRCPSVLYAEEAMARAAAPFIYTDANEFYESSQRRRRLQEWRTRLYRDWESEVYLETLLSFLRSHVQESTRDYNR